MMRAQRIALVLLGSAFAVGCQTIADTLPTNLRKSFESAVGIAPKVPVVLTRAPTVVEAAAYRRVALVAFSGHDGKGFTQDLEAALSKATVSGRRVLQLFPSDEVLLATRGQALNSQSATQLSARYGADAVVFGEVTNARVTPTSYTSQESTCVRYSDASQTKCTQSRLVNVSCVRKEGAYDVFVRVYDARRGEMVHAAAVPGRAQTEGCKDKVPRDDAGLLEAAQGFAVQATLQLISLADVLVQVPMMNATSGMNSAAKEATDKSVEWARSGRLEHACERARAAVTADAKSVTTQFNAGLCDEAAGRSGEAWQRYQAADKLTTSPETALTEALARTSRQLKIRQAVAKLRPDLTPRAAVAVATAAPPLPPGVERNPSAEAAALVRTEPRVALVIGNAAYQRIGQLANAVNDARDMANALKSLRFQVVYVENGTRDQMGAAVESFGKQLPEGAVGLVFYAGHGAQVKGENYLIPVDADIRSEGEVQYKAVNVGQILDKLEARRARVGIVVLDACRDNPFPSVSRSSRGGLASIDAPSGTLIAYATAPGRTASDGSGKNGLYTGLLLRNLTQPDVAIEDVFKRVRVGVMQATQGEQIPWESSSLTGDFFFAVKN